MFWIARMVIKGVLLLVAAAAVRGCDTPDYNTDARSQGTTVLADHAQDSRSLV